KPHLWSPNHFTQLPIGSRRWECARAALLGRPCVDLPQPRTEPMPARAPLHDTAHDIDLILRHVSRRFPQDLARALIRTGEPIGSATWAETQVTGRQRRLDRALRVKVGSKPRFFHMEWTLRLTGGIRFRVYEYNSLTVLA